MPGPPAARLARRFRPCAAALPCVPPTTAAAAPLPHRPTTEHESSGTALPAGRSHAARKVAKGITEYPAAYGPARVPLRGLVEWTVEGVIRTDPLRSAVPALAAAPCR